MNNTTHTNTNTNTNRLAIGHSYHFFHSKWPSIRGISVCRPQCIVAAGVGGYRSISVSASCRHKKKTTNPDEEVLVNKTNQRSTNKKTYLAKKIKQKRTVWGVIDVYRFITVGKLASLMKKTIGNEQFSILVCA